MNKLATFAAGAAMMLCAVAPASAQVNVKGVGALPCEAYMESFSAGDDNQKLISVLSLYAWVEGYFTGKNSERPLAQQKELGSVVFEQTVNQIGNVCASAPEVRVFEIAEVLYSRLPTLQVPTGV